MSDNPYVNNPGKRPYLICVRYGSIIKPPIQGERQVYFNTPSEIPGANHLIVNDDEVVIGEDGVGLLKLHDIFHSSNEERSLVNIACNDEGGLVKRFVPTEDIVWK